MPRKFDNQNNKNRKKYYFSIFIDIIFSQPFLWFLLFLLSNLWANLTKLREKVISQDYE